MKEQTTLLLDIDSFDLKHIFECGQCFRWYLNSDNSYTGVVRNNVLNIKKSNNNIFISSYGDETLNELVYTYFDLSRDYKKIKSTLSKIDKNIEKSINYGNGIRLLNQDLWETIISFIISANNNIPRIRKIIENICKSYGKKIIWKNDVFYTFPTPKELSNATVEDLRNLGLGFRDTRVYETTQIISSGKINLESLKKQNTNTVRDILLSLPGIGPKVADCILLFSDLKRLEVFPIDVWVRRVMNELYIKLNDESKVNKKEILELANKKYSNLAGLAQQYLFYWKREA